MIRNYFTLYHLAGELHERLAGGCLTDIHSQEKNELTISFATPDGGRLQLIVTVRSREFSLSTRDGLSRKRRNTAGIMKVANGHRVEVVSMAPRDRELLISLEGGLTLICRFFSADTNVLLSREGRIVDAFKEARELSGTPWEKLQEGESRFRALELCATDEPRFIALLEASDSSLPPDRRLASFLPGFDRSLARRLAARARSMAPEALFEALGTLFFELASPSPSVIEVPGTTPEFTIVDVQEQEHATPFDGIIGALDHYTRRMHRHLQLQGRSGQLQRELRTQLERTSKELAELESARLDEVAARYETFGHLLTAAIGTVTPETGTVCVPDLFGPEASMVTIRVRRELNLQQNAAWYFGKAAKSREKRTAAASRKRLLAERLEKLRSSLDELERSSGVDELRRLAGKGTGRKEATGGSRKSGEGQARFRTLLLERGATLYIGRDARNNELLTFGLARPDDLWLHAQGCSGSHCILKGAGLQDTGIIRRAAEIAAWYSSARNSAMVPVMYTLKKYVRKDRKAVGSVFVEREKVLMVKPVKE
jgi:predicted ribosome quality control (RQC) complex YloA/Tae2 family protein